MKAHKGRGGTYWNANLEQKQKKWILLFTGVSAGMWSFPFFKILDNQVMVLRMQKSDTKKNVHFNIFYVNAVFIHSTKLDEGDFASQYLINPIISPAMKPGSISSLQMNSVGL